MSWNGNIQNPVPNNIQRDSGMAGINVVEQRAGNIRRDQDSEKNYAIKLMDIDTAIFSHIDKNINISVVDNGSNIKVPIHYASQEKWKAIQKDGVYRDQQGKVQLPLIAFKRSSFTKNQNLMTLNRHLTYPVIKKFDAKNKYTRFSTLNNYVAPVHQIFGISMPDHIDVSYEFVCWCEYIEQLNTVVQKINFACDEYWGDPKRFKFRVYSNDFSFSSDNPSDQDRMVKATFNLNVKAYLLEESFEDRRQTVNRSLTPRVIKITAEVVSSGKLSEISAESIKKPFDYSYKDNVITPDGESFVQPKVNLNGSVVDSSDTDIISIRKIYENLILSNDQSQSVDGLIKYNDIWKPAPATADSSGEEGWMSYDGDYHYIYVNGRWKRKSIADWTNF